MDRQNSRIAPKFSALKMRMKRLFLSRAPRPLVTRARALRRLQLKHRRDSQTVSGYAPVTVNSPLHLPSRPVHYDFRVGAILDEFSYFAWAPEFNLIPLSEDTSEEQIRSLDFLLVESAWSGNDGEFKSQLTGPHAPSLELQRIIRLCRASDIPTVFWNKEDPVHHLDFIETARLFDVVATTDSDLVDTYRETLKHDQIIVLPFAAQPTIHNPARNGLPLSSGDVAFAGTYFREKFADRRSQMDALLGAAHDVSESDGMDFTIFSRHAGGERRYQFPQKWSKHVTGSLPYLQMLSAYRSFKLFLNVNSVTTSPSMCARRIFELAASGTPILSTPSKAIPNFFEPNEVISVGSRSEAAFLIRGFAKSELLRRKTAHRALRRVWEEHTYAHRARQLLDAINMTLPQPKDPLVSVICSTNRDQRLEHLLNQVSQQSYNRKELVILGHGIDFTEDLFDRARALGIENLRVLSAPSTWTLGECLNKLVENSNGDIIAKFDDDDFYLNDYLSDQVNTLINMNADLVGKASLYFYLPSLGTIARRWPEREHTWHGFVAGATLVGWRSLFTETPFRKLNKGEDSEFLIDLESKGKRVYSSDSFNYLCVRGNTQHTWQISETEILANSQVETFGLNLEHVSA